jgi:hypothetical protein
MYSMDVQMVLQQQIVLVNIQKLVLLVFILKLDLERREIPKSSKGRTKEPRNFSENSMFKIIALPNNFLSG